MRKLKWLAIIALLVCAHGARGQCSNGPCYTANPPTITRRTPAQAATLGVVTITSDIYTSNASGSKPSHNGQYTVGTWVGIDVTCRNCASRSWYYTINGGAPQGAGSGPVTNNPETDTNTHAWLTNTGDIGNTITFVNTGYSEANLTGDSTQDWATFTVVDGSKLSPPVTGPAVISQDSLPENTILHFHASGGGGSMLNDFTMCQGANQQHCINATHTPQTWLTVKNLKTGFTLSHAKHVSGNVAKANESVSFSDDIFLPALPEDTFDYSEGDEVDCSISGPVGVGPVQMDIRFERAITEEYISSILNSNGMHPEHIYCIIAATPPDFPGADEALPGTPSGQIVNIAFLYREWPKGTQEKGTPWNLVFPDIQEVGIGYYVKTTMEPDPVGCTMWDNGFRHLPLPTPLDPQPQ